MVLTRELASLYSVAIEEHTGFNLVQAPSSQGCSFLLFTAPVSLARPRSSVKRKDEAD